MDGNRSTDYGLNRFIPLPENRVAHHAVRRVLDSAASDRLDLSDLLPLFVYGPPGSGKTHLLRGTAQAFLERHSEARLTIIQPDDPAALGTPVPEGLSSPPSWRREVVLIEDLHRFREHSVREEDLVRVLDGLSERIVLVSSQCLPQRLEWLGGRIISRLLRGLVVCIAEPGRASRARLLLEFAARRQLPLGPAQIESLVNRLPASVRQLEALATALVVTAGGQSSPAEVLAAFLAGDPDLSPDQRLSRIIRPIAEVFRVNPASLRSARRDRCLLRPRQVAMYLARERTQLPLQRIGRFFGGRDHATVLHACRKVEHDAGVDPALAGLLRELRSQVAEC